jgi:hypothetical protein
MGAEQSIKDVIKFWERLLFDAETGAMGFLGITTIVMIQDTIKKLKDLEKIKGGPR